MKDYYPSYYLVNNTGLYSIETRCNGVIDLIFNFDETLPIQGNFRYTGEQPPRMCKTSVLKIN